MWGTGHRYSTSRSPVMVAAFKQPHVTHPHAIDVTCVEHIFKTTCEIEGMAKISFKPYGKQGL